jgi:hypothetical protein
MFFWKKPSKKIVRWFTTHVGLPEMYPPAPLSKHTPEWWKKTPAYSPTSKNKGGWVPQKLQKTVKHCYAVQKLWENSFALPLWWDMFVGLNSKGEIGAKVPANQTPGENHPVEQYPGMLSSGWVNWKVKSPWVVYTEEYLPFYVSSPFYHIQDHNWQTMPGHTEFFHQHHTNINMIFRKPSSSAGLEYEFRAGDIIAYLTPMFEGDVEFICETIDQKELDRLEFGQKMWFNPATFARRNNIGGCPFHRG